MLICADSVCTNETNACGEARVRCSSSGKPRKVYEAIWRRIWLGSLHQCASDQSSDQNVRVDSKIHSLPRIGMRKWTLF